MICRHLEHVWKRGKDARKLILESDLPRELLETNPKLALAVFTSRHPKNQQEWNAVKRWEDDPMLDGEAMDICKMLKTIKTTVDDNAKEGELELDGLALSVLFFESCTGISTNRPKLDDHALNALPSNLQSTNAETIYDELCYLLLEGIISERGDETPETPQGTIYRSKLNQLLRWPNACYRPERLLAALPSGFLKEHALLLGRLHRHEDALRILYLDLDDLPLALRYCDERADPSAYLPLLKVALAAHGAAAAVKVLALRGDKIDRGAALRLLPKTLPLAAFARPFILPALVDGDSQIRRLTVAAGLLRARYLSLQVALADAQLRSRSTLQSILPLLDLPPPLRSSPPSLLHGGSQFNPSDALCLQSLQKHHFPRHLLLQARLKSSSARPLKQVRFDVADSSDDAVRPARVFPIPTLPPGRTGSAWVVLDVDAFHGTIALTCELGYVLEMANVDGEDHVQRDGEEGGRVFVEELTELHLRSTEFDEC